MFAIRYGPHRMLEIQTLNFWRSEILGEDSSRTATSRLLDWPLARLPTSNSFPNLAKLMNFAKYYSKSCCTVCTRLWVNSAKSLSQMSEIFHRVKGFRRTSCVVAAGAVLAMLWLDASGTDRVGVLSDGNISLLGASLTSKPNIRALPCRYFHREM